VPAAAVAGVGWTRVREVTACAAPICTPTLASSVRWELAVSTAV
jgi:hypothetical protein